MISRNGRRSSENSGMKIAMDISIMESCRTGTEEYTEGLVWGLHRVGTSVVGMGRPGAAILPNQPCLGLNHRSHRAWWRKWWWENLGIMMAPRNVDLIHIPYMAHPPRPLAVPVVVTVHDLIPFRLASYHHRLRERMYFDMVRRRLPQATALVAISQATLQDVDDFFPGLASKVTVIPNGVHPTFFQPVRVEQMDALLRELRLIKRPRILYVGGYDERKNVQTLVKAAQEVFDRRRDGELVLVGALHQPQMVRLVSELGMERHSVLTPSVSRLSLAALYQASDIFAFPSTYEGFGLGPAQALAAGVPVVASNIPAVSEVVGEAGILVSPRSVQEWVQALQRVLESPALSQKMVARGKARAEDFAWERVALQYQKLYGRLVR